MNKNLALEAQVKKLKQELEMLRAQGDEAGGPASTRKGAGPESAETESAG